MSKRPSMGKRAAIAFAVALSLCIPHATAQDSGSVPASPDRPGRVSAIAREAEAAADVIMKKRNASAISAVLVDRDGVLWQGQFGETSRGNGQAPNPETVFGIASISKMFTTVAVLKLSERGLVSLDEPVVTYIPEFRMEDPRYRGITVRMLLNHSSGLPGYQSAGSLTSGAPFPGYAEHTLRAQTFQRLKFAPGSEAIYTNDGFTLLEILIRRITGLPYTEFLRREVLEPLGMGKTRHMDAPLHAGSAAIPDPDKYFASDYFVNIYGTGGLFASASDMAEFARSFLQPGRILSAASIEAMGRDQTVGMFHPVGEGKGARFGLGWDTVFQTTMSAFGFRSWQKSGDLVFYGSTMIVLPDEGLAAVVMGATNFGSADAEEMAERMLLAALSERGRIPGMPERAPWLSAPAEAPDLRERAEIAGYYAGGPLGFTRAAFDAHGVLTLEARTPDGWMPAYEGLEKRTDGWYSKPGFPISLRFVVDGGRRFCVMRYPKGYGNVLTELPMAQKLDAHTPLPEAWRNRTGAMWLLADDITEADDSVLTRSPSIIPKELAEAPGYIAIETADDFHLVKPLDPDTAAMWITTPVVFGRDLKDLRAESAGGAEYLRFGAERYRRADTVPALPGGVTPIPNAVRSDMRERPTGSWFRLRAENGAVTVSNAALWRLYDSELRLLSSGRGGGRPDGAPDGAWLVVYPAEGGGAEIRAGG